MHHDLQHDKGPQGGMTVEFEDVYWGSGRIGHVNGCTHVPGDDPKVAAVGPEELFRLLTVSSLDRLPEFFNQLA